ncbi:MAG: hypothetical protein HUJ25_09110 [Crocinitomicaceae bacterium]|nr:hypothetical protein [Crocinitomicaceae bacterium]
MKSRYYSTFLMLFLMMFVANIASARAVIVLSEDKADYVQTDNSYTLNFDIEGTENDISLINSRAEPMKDKMSLSTKKIRDGLYEAVFIAKDNNTAENVKKMLMMCGFQVVKHKGKTYGLSQIIDILKSYQE